LFPGLIGFGAIMTVGEEVLSAMPLYFDTESGDLIH
jgi:hypothetical protein